MKSKLVLVLGFAVGLFLTGCDIADDYSTTSSAGNTVCLPTLSGSQCNGNTVDSCADSSGAWYEVNGSTYCYVAGASYVNSSCAQNVVNNFCSRPAAKGGDTESDSDLLVDLMVTKAENLNLQNKVADLMGLINQDLVSQQ